MMDLGALYREEDAVAPVVATLLMVTVTVILAAVIGAFVLQLAGVIGTTPTARLDVDVTDATQINVTYEGGETLTDSEVSIRVGQDVAYDGTGNATGTGDILGDYASGSQASDGWGEDVSAGDEVRLDDGSAGADHTDETVRVVWHAPEGDKTQILLEDTWET